MFGSVGLAKGALLALYSSLLSFQALQSSSTSISTATTPPDSSSSSSSVGGGNTTTLPVVSNSPTRDPDGVVSGSSPYSPEVLGETYGMDILRRTFNYVECYHDRLASVEGDRSQVLSVHLSGITDVMSRTPSKQQPTMCAHACWEDGYRMAGIRMAYQCWCGVAVSPQALAAECQPCHGNTSYLCGSSWSMAVYLLDSVPPKVSICHPERIVLVGAQVTLQCSSLGEGPVSFAWYRHLYNGTEQLLESGGNVVISGGLLTITQVNPFNAGRYICRVKSDFFPGLPRARDTATARVYVQIPPTVRLVRTGEISPGGQVKLLCSAYGDKPMFLSWTKDGRALGMTHHERIFIRTWVQNSSSILTLSRLEATDSARYSCTAKNQRIVDIAQRVSTAHEDINVLSPHAAIGKHLNITDAVTGNISVNEGLPTVPPSASSLAAEEKPLRPYTSRRMVIVISSLCTVCILLLSIVLAVVIRWKREVRKTMPVVLAAGPSRSASTMGRHDTSTLPRGMPCDTMQSMSSRRYVGEAAAATSTGVVILNPDKSASLLSVRTADLPFPFNQPRRNTCVHRQGAGEDDDATTRPGSICSGCDCGQARGTTAALHSQVTALPRGSVPPWLAVGRNNSLDSFRGVALQEGESDAEELHPNALVAYNLSTPASVYMNPGRDF
ncbi:uncharacterized protein LOC135808365 [Sycon ciliatum]|uniref:uncharacterized protein LOC135808365 n=1 Tax=Sycon ciliatum TaxID=27933 RepID=UPI0031F616F3